MENTITKLKETFQEKKGTTISEEATKHSLVLPFFKSLGYDIFDSSIFAPEFNADVGIKKGEKVDYAILQNNKTLAIIEVKSFNTSLINHINQIYRYFAASETKLAILTNGIQYDFFTDSKKENIMDIKPFYTFNLFDYNDIDLKILELFQFGKLEMKNLKSRVKDFTKIKVIRNNDNPLTNDEIIAFTIIKSILSTQINYKRISYINSKSYCSIVIDGKRNNWICRLVYRGTFGAPKGFLVKSETNHNGDKITINNNDDLYKYDFINELNKMGDL